MSHFSLVEDEGPISVDQSGYFMGRLKKVSTWQKMTTLYLVKSIHSNAVNNIRFRLRMSEARTLAMEEISAEEASCRSSLKEFPHKSELNSFALKSFIATFQGSATFKESNIA
jgi:hypothetical protein